MSDIAALNSRFSIQDQLIFKAVGGIAVAEIANAHATASICTQGGHVMTWRPNNEAEPVVWISKLAKVVPGKSIRGGMPICWPWFGAHATESSYPGHGYARTVPWEVIDTQTLADGATEIALALVESDQTRAMWLHRSKLTVRVTIGKTLKVTLTTDNLGKEDFVIGEALHTYFQIGDIAEVRLTGLEDCEYVDKVKNLTHQRQQGAVTFNGETDRVYVDTESKCVIEDARLKRRIVVAKSGSRSTVVWTPWTDKADKMGDFGTDGWRAMLCVESANALQNQVTVKAGSSHTLSVEYSTAPL